MSNNKGNSCPNARDQIEFFTAEQALKPGLHNNKCLNAQSQSPFYLAHLKQFEMYFVYDIAYCKMFCGFAHVRKLLMVSS